MTGVKIKTSFTEKSMQNNAIITTVIKTKVRFNFKQFCARQVWVWIIQGGPKKRHKVYSTIILQPYITESCGFQQNVLKEILYMPKVSV